MVWLGFGERGLARLYRSEMEYKAYVERIRLLAEENQSLIEEINCLRTDMKYIETLARRELNLIAKNEVIYRFDKEKNHEDGVRDIPPKAQYYEKTRLSKRELRRNGGNR